MDFENQNYHEKQQRRRLEYVFFFFFYIPIRALATPYASSRQSELASFRSQEALQKLRSQGFAIRYGMEPTDTEKNSNPFFQGISWSNIPRSGSSYSSAGLASVSSNSTSSSITSTLCGKNHVNIISTISAQLSKASVSSSMSSKDESSFIVNAGHNYGRNIFFNSSINDNIKSVNELSKKQDNFAMTATNNDSSVFTPPHNSQTKSSAYNNSPPDTQSALSTAIPSSVSSTKSLLPPCNNSTHASTYSKETVSNKNDTETNSYVSHVTSNIQSECFIPPPQNNNHNCNQYDQFDDTTSYGVSSALPSSSKALTQSASVATPLRNLTSVLAEVVSSTSSVSPVINDTSSCSNTDSNDFDTKSTPSDLRSSTIGDKRQVTGLRRLGDRLKEIDPLIVEHQQKKEENEEFDPKKQMKHNKIQESPDNLIHSKSSNNNNRRHYHANQWLSSSSDSDSISTSSPPSSPVRSIASQADSKIREDCKNTKKSGGQFRNGQFNSADDEDLKSLSPLRESTTEMIRRLSSSSQDRSSVVVDGGVILEGEEEDEMEDGDEFNDSQHDLIEKELLILSSHHYKNKRLFLSSIRHQNTIVQKENVSTLESNCYFIDESLIPASLSVPTSNVSQEYNESKINCLKSKQINKHKSKKKSDRSSSEDCSGNDSTCGDDSKLSTNWSSF